jgi:hypothetical protein
MSPILVDSYPLVENNLSAARRISCLRSSFIWALASLVLGMEALLHYKWVPTLYKIGSRKTALAAKMRMAVHPATKILSYPRLYCQPHNRQKSGFLSIFAQKTDAQKQFVARFITVL